jgi:hypothetical protein
MLQKEDIRLACLERSPSIRCAHYLWSADVVAPHLSQRSEQLILPPAIDGINSTSFPSPPSASSPCQSVQLRRVSSTRLNSQQVRVQIDPPARKRSGQNVRPRAVPQISIQSIQLLGGS